MKTNASVSNDPNQTHLRVMSGTDRDGSRSHQWQVVLERRPVTQYAYTVERGASANFGTLNNSHVGNIITGAAPSSRALGLKSQKRISDYNTNPNCYGSKHLNKPPIKSLSPQQQVIEIVNDENEDDENEVAYISDSKPSCNKVVNRTNYDDKSKVEIVTLFDDLTKPIKDGGKGMLCSDALKHCRTFFGQPHLSINSINNFRKLMVSKVNTFGKSRGHHVDRKFRDYVYNKLRFKAVYTEYKGFRNSNITLPQKVERIVNCCYSYEVS